MSDQPVRHYTLQDHMIHSRLPVHVQMARHSVDFHIHSHDFSELIIVLAGEACHLVGEHTYPLKQGDLFVVHPGVPHGFSDTDRLRLLNIMFSLEKPLFDLNPVKSLPGFHRFFTLDPMLRRTGGFRSGLSLKEEQWDAVTGLAYRMHREYSGGEPGFEGMITALFQELVITLSREKSSGTSDAAPGTDPLARAIVYLQEHFRDKVTSEEIAAAACVTPRHLNRLFSTILSTTPFEYLTDLRLQEARRLLAREPLRITEAAERCGFSDSNYFSRVFRRRYGISPRAFREASGDRF